MSGCDVVGERPLVWKDDDGWRCDQVKFCRRCSAVWQDSLAEESTWREALAAAERVQGEAGEGAE